MSSYAIYKTPPSRRRGAVVARLRLRRYRPLPSLAAEAPDSSEPRIVAVGARGTRRDARRYDWRSDRQDDRQTKSYRVGQGTALREDPRARRAPVDVRARLAPETRAIRRPTDSRDTQRWDRAPWSPRQVSIPRDDETLVIEAIPADEWDT